jgi:uncharacterized delta-60 repeat protein
MKSGLFPTRSAVSRLLGFLLLFTSGVVSQTLDSTFVPVTDIYDARTVHSTAVQSDGKVLYGSFTITRLLTNGEIDKSFAQPLIGRNIEQSAIYFIRVLKDDKILIAGDFGSVNGNARIGLARLNADGSLDGTFVPNSPFQNFLMVVRALGVQSDGKIIAGSYKNQSNILWRLNVDGSLDGTFRSSVSPDTGGFTSIAVAENDSFVIAHRHSTWQAGSRVSRYLSDGSPDPSFNTAAVEGKGFVSGETFDVAAMAIQQDGKVLIGGSLTEVNGVQKSRIARLNADGTLDDQFKASADESVLTLSFAGDGSILAGGKFSRVNEVERKRVARLRSDGTLDADLNAPIDQGFAAVHTISAQTDSKIIIGGLFLKVGAATRDRLARLNTDGSLDSSFKYVFVGKSGTVNRLAIAADGRIWIAGQYSSINGEYIPTMALLRPDGSTDTSFPVTLNSSNNLVTALLPLPGSRVLVGGGTFPMLNSFNSNGTADPTFKHPFTSSNTQYVNALALQDDGKILVGGKFSISGTAANIIRLNSDGSRDVSFMSGLSGTDSAVYAITVKNDGKIMIGGDFTIVNGMERRRIARLNADGTVDDSFQNGMAGANAAVFSVSIDAEGKAVVAGSFDMVNGISSRNLVRLNADGSVDTSFLNGLSGPDGTVRGSVILPNGKVVITGGFRTVNGTTQPVIAQLLSDGSLDPAFSIGVVAPSFMMGTALALDNLGNILVSTSGETVVNGQQRSSMFRLNYTANYAAVRGRVVTPLGAGLRNANVYLIFPDGSRRAIVTSSLGYFSFDDVPASLTPYRVSISSKRYRFQSKEIVVQQDVEMPEMIAVE